VEVVVELLSMESTETGWQGDSRYPNVQEPLMAKFLIGLVTGIILSVLLGVVVVFSLARFGTEKRVTISPNSTLLLQLDGEIPERSPIEYPKPLVHHQTASTVKDVWVMLG
jgi:hypothetical protein